jgi:tocopherol O-methyltransferase
MPKTLPIHASGARKDPAPQDHPDPAALGHQEAKDKVRRYYLAATQDYLRYYEASWHQHMHYGFDRNLPRGGNPTENMVKYMAEVAGIRAADVVLDAGCGVGGSSSWLAKEIGCRCVGITLVPFQAALARGFAAKKGVVGTSFVANDFTRPAFAPESFDVVWALESFDHAPDKRAWVADMFRLLKPGGRLIIADGFQAEKLEPARAETYRKFLAGWAVPHLCTAAELETWAGEAGFKKAHAEDITKDVFPHALAIFRFGVLFIPVRWLLCKLGLTSKEKLGNAVATYYQYTTLKRGMWSYGVFCFRKPG